MELPEDSIPHIEHVFCWSNDMKRFVRSVQDVDNGEPPVLIVLGKLKLLAVIPRVWAGSKLLDVLDGDCA